MLVSDEPPLLAAGSSAAPSVSADGSRAAFVGRAVKGPDDPGLGRRQVYLWDAGTGQVSLVSHGADSLRPAGCFSTWPDISADGRFVAFSSCATDLGAPATEPADRRRPNIYLFDTRTGRTSLISRSTSPPRPGGDGFSIDPVVSPHGRYVAFTSQADNLVPGTLPFNADVFLYDRSTRTTSLVSVGRSGEPADSISDEPDLVRGARLIVWTSFADNITADPDVDEDDGLDPDVFVTRRSTGRTRLVSHTPTGHGYNFEPAVSASGSDVVYTSEDALVPRDTNGTRDVYSYDLGDGRTRLVSAPAGGSADSFSQAPQVSASGRFVAFQSWATNLGGGGMSGEDVFRRDMRTGAVRYVSHGAGGADGNGTSQRASISADGTTVAYDSFATNVHPDDTDPRLDVLSWRAP